MNEHLLHGTFRRDRHADRADGLVAAGMPAKPADMPPDASELWDSIIGTLPPAALASVDYAALTACCRWYAQLQSNLRKLEAGDGDAYKLTTLAAMGSKQFTTFAQRFGLTPGDRAKLRLPAQDSRPHVPSRNRSA